MDFGDLSQIGLFSQTELTERADKILKEYSSFMKNWKTTDKARINCCTIHFDENLYVNV